MVRKIIKKNKFSNAIVGRAWFHKNNTEAVIVEQASFDIVKGIRSKPTITFSRNTLQYIKDGSIQDEKWRSGSRLLEKYNLNNDLRVTCWHLEEAVEIVRLIPNTTVIINHAGFPWDKSEEGRDFWRKGIKLISLEPNTYIKLSEFGANGQDRNYAENANIICELIDFFSPDRCMFASNFPVSKLKVTF